MKIVTYTFHLPIKPIFLCQSVPWKSSRYLCINWFLSQPSTFSHTPHTLIKKVQSSPQAAWNKTWLRRLEQKHQNRSIFKALLYSEWELWAWVSSIRRSHSQVSSPLRSDPVAKALSSLLLLLPYALYALSPCCDSSLTFLSTCCSWWFSVCPLLPYFILVLLQNLVVCVPFSSSSLHDHKKTLQSKTLFS